MILIFVSKISEENYIKNVNYKPKKIKSKG